MGEDSRRPVVDFLCSHMARNRCKPDFARQTRIGLASREASLWARAKSPFRRLVWLVRDGWHIAVSAEVADLILLKCP